MAQPALSSFLSLLQQVEVITWIAVSATSQPSPDFPTSYLYISTSRHIILYMLSSPPLHIIYAQPSPSQGSRRRSDLINLASTATMDSKQVYTAQSNCEKAISKGQEPGREAARCEQWDDPANTWHKPTVSWLTLL